MLAVNDNAKDDYDDPWSNAVLKAQATGREEAVSAIFEKGMAIRDIAYSGKATREKWKARGALNIWRAAYAAAYREMLAIANGDTGLMDTIPDHPEEGKRRINGYADMVCAKAAEAPCDDDELPF